jgi:hypothetical protein
VVSGGGGGMEGSAGRVQDGRVRRDMFGMESKSNGQRTITRCKCSD